MRPTVRLSIAGGTRAPVVARALAGLPRQSASQSSSSPANSADTHPPRAVLLARPPPPGPG
eukprot:1778337-Lingulodinium_polyedra.AAC.1